jgi:hypothetical protein
MSDLYKFDVQNGQVVSQQEFEDGRWQFERLERGVSFVVRDQDILKIEFEDRLYEVSVFSPVNKETSIYSRTSKSYFASNPLSDLAGSGSSSLLSDTDSSMGHVDSHPHDSASDDLAEDEEHGFTDSLNGDAGYVESVEEQSIDESYEGSDADHGATEAFEGALDDLDANATEVETSHFVDTEHVDSPADPIGNAIVVEVGIELERDLDRDSDRAVDGVEVLDSRNDDVETAFPSSRQVSAGSSDSAQGELHDQFVGASRLDDEALEVSEASLDDFDAHFAEIKTPHTREIDQANTSDPAYLVSNMSATAWSREIDANLIDDSGDTATVAQKLDLGDVITVLKLFLGLHNETTINPLAYVAADLDRDGALTLGDTILALKGFLNLVDESKLTQVKYVASHDLEESEGEKKLLAADGSYVDKDHIHVHEWDSLDAEAQQVSLIGISIVDIDSYVYS